MSQDTNVHKKCLFCAILRANVSEMCMSIIIPGYQNLMNMQLQYTVFYIAHLDCSQSPYFSRKCDGIEQLS